MPRTWRAKFHIEYFLELEVGPVVDASSCEFSPSEEEDFGEDG